MGTTQLNGSKVIKSTLWVMALVCAQAVRVQAEEDGVHAGVVGDGTPASCTSNALQTALTGGGLVTFNCGPNPVTIITDTYVINTDTTIDGGSLITLDGENLRQHFLVQPSGTLTLRNINLHKGNASNGGSIYNNGVVVINRVNFVGNGANDTGGAIYSLGALDIRDANFIQNKTVTNTVAIGYGGAIASLGVMTLTNGYFGLNDGRFGGAVFVGGTGPSVRATIEGATFNQNRAAQFGGGLYTNAETTAITVTRSAFYQNSANTGGGLGRFSAQLRVLDSSFVQNNAATGGGMWVGAGPTAGAGGYVQLRSVTMSGNTATGGQGGGILNNGLVEVYFATVVSNTNGIFSNGAGVVTRLRSTVLQNPGTLNCDGGGITPSNDGFNHSTDNSCSATIPAAGDPKLGPLQNDGSGTTSYHLPLLGSPLINTGAPDCPLLDQRGASRPDTCDIGAVEFGGLLPRSHLPIVVR